MSIENVRSIIFSNLVYGSFQHITTQLELPFNYEPLGFSDEDDIEILIEQMEKTVKDLGC